MENSDEISLTDACFIELNALGYRISGALSLLIESAEKLPVFATEVSKYSNLHKDKFLVKSMWEHIILNLYKLIEIHDSILGKILNENKAIDLEKCLEPSWSVIRDLREKICLYRNSIAHSKDQANNYISFMDMDTDYYQTQTKLIVAANAAIFYISGIFENLPDLYSNSRVSLKFKLDKIKEWHPHDEITNARQSAIDVLNITNETLVKNGYTAAHEMKYN